MSQPAPGRRLRRWGLASWVVAGSAALLAAFTPWWYTSTSTGSTSVAEFYPGTDLYAGGGGGGGGFTSYVGYGVGRVGALYEAVLILTVLAAVLAWGSVALAIAGSGSTRTSGWRRTGRTVGAVATVGLLAALVVAVPIAQPLLYGADNPHGTCTSASAPGACGSFWGSTHASGTTTTWGAGAGWWSTVAGAALAGAGWAAVRRANRPAPPESGPSSRASERARGSDR